MIRASQEEFTREELRRMAWLHLFRPRIASRCCFEFGTHTEACWKMARASPKREMHPSALMETVADELDADPTFAGSRDR